MFFNKSLRTSDSLPVEDGSAPIYVAGITPLGVFLSTQLQLSGKRVVMVDTPEKTATFHRNELVCRDERTLKSCRISFNCTATPDEDAAYLFICPSPQNRFSLLTLLPRSHFTGAGIINFDPAGNSEKLMELFSAPVINAYFKGCLEYRPEQLTVLDNSAVLTLTLSDSDERARGIRSLFEKSGLEIVTRYDNAANFWTHFIPDTLAGLTSAAFGKNISALSQDEDDRRLLDDCLEELISLAAQDNVTVAAADVLRQLYTLPAHYAPELSAELKKRSFSRLDNISSVILDRGTASAVPTTALRRLLRQIYNKSLA